MAEPADAGSIPMSVIRIGIVAGEASGDQLGAPLITELKSRYPQVVFEGIGGERMITEGFVSLFPMERLSVMGLVDPLKRLPELLSIRKALFRHFIDNKFDLVIGIDSPDFNLGLELKLRKQGVRTAHYVSPSVWAWRQGRVKKIAKAVDLMLTLFPFEEHFYKDHNVPVTFVGHPLAEQFPDHPVTDQAKQQLGIEANQRVVAVMPGSRRSEVEALGRLFFDTAVSCSAALADTIFVVPAASPAIYRQLEALQLEYSQLPMQVIHGRSHLVMEAADIVLLASGTTALEAMLLKKPMVVSYKMGSLSYKLLSRFIKAPFISLPNLLAGKELVPELIQDQATVKNLSDKLVEILGDNSAQQKLQAEFSRLHQQLNLPSSSMAADALCQLIASPS